MQKMQKESATFEEEEPDLFDMMKADATDDCTIEKLKIKHNLEDLLVDKEIDNKYMIDI
jgi:hypothetical protein